MLLSPDEKSNPCSSYSTKNKKYNTIESKFRSAEKSNQKKLMPLGVNSETDNYLLRSIDDNIYSNIKVKPSDLTTEKRLTVRQLDARMKRAIKQHKETFTFGVPTSYSKLQSNIKGLIQKIDKNVEEPTPGYSNEKQRRVYKNELLQESFKNKMGLINKPSIDQLLIGDFIREKKHKNTIYGGSGETRAYAAQRMKTNISDNSLLCSSKQDQILENYHDLKLRRRYTSNAGDKTTDDFLDLDDAKPHNSVVPINAKSGARKNKSKRKGRISKIRLRNPSKLKGKLYYLFNSE